MITVLTSIKEKGVTTEDIVRYAGDFGLNLTDAQFNKLKVWSDNQQKYVHSPAFFDALKQDVAIVFVLDTPLNWNSWAIQTVIAAGHPLAVIHTDGDGWCEKIPAFRGTSADYTHDTLTRPASESYRLYWETFGPHINKASALWKLDESWADVLFPEAQDSPGMDLPGWLKAEYLQVESYSVTHLTQVYRDKQGVKQVVENRSKTWHRSYYIHDGSHEQITDDLLNHELRDMREEYDTLSSLCGCPDDSAHYKGTTEQWERLGVLEQYFGHINGDEDSSYGEWLTEDDEE